MKFTIRDSSTDDAVKLDLQKHPRNKSIALVLEDSRKKILELSADHGTLKLSVDSEEGVEVTQMSSAERAGFVDPPPVAPGADKLRNWKSLPSGALEVVHPRTGRSVALDPGPLFGENLARGFSVDDILGQPEMTFAVAYALAGGHHSLLIGPTGTGKTSTYRWFAERLGWNLVIAPIARGTEAAHLVGDYMPTGQALFEWMDGPVTEAIRLSQQAPTILVFDEINRIGNIAELARVYSVLDDTRMLELKERRDDHGNVERLTNGRLLIGATSNPSDDEMADYIGVQELDPALSSRFAIQPTVSYPPPEVELEALCARVPGIDRAVGHKMVQTVNAIRNSSDVRFPASFRELVAWAQAYDDFGYVGAAEVALVNKAARDFRQAIMNEVKLR